MAEEKVSVTKSTSPNNSDSIFMVVLVILIVVAIAGGGIYWMMTQAGESDDQGGAFTTQAPLPTTPLVQATSTPRPTQVVSPTVTIEPTSEVTPTPENILFSLTPTVTPAVMGDEDSTVRKIEVSGRSFSFSPAEIRVQRGERVRIVFTSLDGTHDFVIDELEVATRQVNTGQTDAVEFVADQAGSFEFYCSVGNHRAQGMVGTLIVE